MPLLGLGKKQEPEKKEQVPDELPDLPETPVLADDDSSVSESIPELGSLAPDELPPVSGEVNLDSEPIEDKRLYFSSMLQKLHEEGIKSTKLTLQTTNILSDMKKHWQKAREEDNLEAMRKKVVDSIEPLKQLEQEWIALQEEIENKKRILKDKEDEIKRLAEEAKAAALKAEKMGAK